jgi:hypothetical protein
VTWNKQAHQNGRILVARGLGNQDQFHMLYSQISACQRAIHELGDGHNQTVERIVHNIWTMNRSIQRITIQPVVQPAQQLKIRNAHE